MPRQLVLSQIKRLLNQSAPFATVILFGSEARGEARIDSDIDLLIVIPDNLKSGYNKIRSQITDLLYDIELRHGILISPLILTQSMWTAHTTPFTLNVLKDGITL